MSENSKTPEEDPSHLKKWQDVWADFPLQGGHQFHFVETNQFLLNHFEKLTDGKKALKILVPLCGKSIDMKWFDELGHHVVGVEISEIAIKQFFELQKTEFDVEDVPALKGKVFKSKDGNIKIYMCDFFDFNETIEGQFDVVWDRGGLVAMEPVYRPKYTSTIKKLLGPDCRYLLEVFQYDKSKVKEEDLPQCFFEKDLEEIYGDICEVKKMYDQDVNRPDLFGDLNPEFAYYYMTPK